MPHENFKKISKLFLILLFIFSTSENVFSADYEKPGKISASKILPKSWLKGPNHKIVEKVVTYNGLNNHFIIESKFGRFKIVGNGMVPVRIQEINAIAELDKMKKSRTFVDGLKESSGTLLKSGVNLIIHPVDTISGFPGGIITYLQIPARSSVKQLGAKPAWVKLRKKVGRQLAAFPGTSAKWLSMWG